jgi:hypothetical protein
MCINIYTYVCVYMGVYMLGIVKGEVSLYR